MDQTNDGGPAFPVPRDAPVDGMSLRDYFAGQALAGLLACPKTSGGEEAFALHAYKYADAMLAEQQKERW